ncbi:MAG: hypothetical protein IT445_02120 [Phycisphaeraceae bacterium]|nr:hypothetical protein [Phycisphaeraceae bacterium]
MKSRNQQFIYGLLALSLAFATVLKADLVSDYRFDDSSQVSGTGATRIVDDGPALTHGDLRWNGAFYDIHFPIPGAASFPASGAGLPNDFLGGNHGTALDMPYSGVNNSSHVAFGPINTHDFERLDFTICGWFSKAGTVGQGIIYDNAVQDFGGQLIYVNGSGELAFEIKGGAGGGVVEPGDNIGIVSDNAVNDGLWHSFVARVSSETATLYIDGALQSQSATYGINTKARPTGSKGTRMAVEFGGQIDTLRIFSHALSLAEINAFSPFAHAGDANFDGMVNLSDLQILGDNWQSTTADWSTANFTGDDTVNLADLQILGDNWGFGAGPDVAFDAALEQLDVVIPEPASLMLLGITMTLVLRRRG